MTADEETSVLKISRILHAGYLFETAQSRILFDPIFENPFSQNCYAFPSVKFDHTAIRELQVSAVFISHYHDDHCSFESLNHLDRAIPIYIYCLHEEMFDWLKELGFQTVIPLRLNKAVQIGSMTVTPRRALDADVDSLFQIEVAGLKILNVVDSWIDEETLAELVGHGPWEMVLWPFQTMRELEVIAPSRATPASGTLPEEWVLQLKSLNPQYVVPSSCQFLQEEWSWYNHAFFPITYQRFQEEVEAQVPSTKVVRLNPGRSVTLTANELIWAEPIAWVHPVGEQEVDYQYQPEFPPPSVASIAQHFSALEAEQANRVRRFCEKEILEIYQSLPTPEDPYFAEQRVWRLTLFDHRGLATHYWYEIQAGHMKPLADSRESEVAWITEVPAAKVFAALERGESLTSMYLRINDFVFSDKIESMIGPVDIVEDPLIRCLFNGRFGSYQRAQLSRLKTEHRLRD